VPTYRRLPSALSATAHARPERTWCTGRSAIVMSHTKTDDAYCSPSERSRATATGQSRHRGEHSRQRDAPLTVVGRADALLRSCAWTGRHVRCLRRDAGQAGWIGRVIPADGPQPHGREDRRGRPAPLAMAQSPSRRSSRAGSEPPVRPDAPAGLRCPGRRRCTWSPARNGRRAGAPRRQRSGRSGRRSCPAGGRARSPRRWG
jgi:hypothetical protein